ncbi:MAG: cytochrome c oxidase assembly protein, partial [Actinomycetia bacterium]|nr:cytochrome c oxidase assembly protein [Actinomycetes bacterium]
MHGMEGMSGPMWMPHLAPTVTRLLATHLQPVPLFPVLCVLLVIAYAAGIVVVRRRGGHWPMGRAIAFGFGLVVMWQVTATGVEGYGMMLFSVHMFQHMMLTMTVPILLLMGAPVTLALRALPARGHGSALRRTIVTVLHSRAARVLMSPPVRWFVFLSGLYAIYFTPLFDSLMSNVWGHYLMLGHFLV